MNVPYIDRAGSTVAQNSRGEWVPAIPLPFYRGLRRCRCECGRTFRNEETYQGHYALVHILGMGGSR